MTTPSTIPDALPGVKSWIAALGLLPGGIYYRLPNSPSTVPFGRLSRNGGGPQADAEVPVTTIRVSVEIWGLANSDYETVRTAALALEQAVHAVNGPTVMGTSGLIMLGGNVLTSYDAPDPDTGFPRYIVMLAITVRGGD